MSVGRSFIATVMAAVTSQRANLAGDMKFQSASKQVWTWEVCTRSTQVQCFEYEQVIFLSSVVYIITY